MLKEIEATLSNPGAKSQATQAPQATQATQATPAFKQRWLAATLHKPCKPNRGNFAAQNSATPWVCTGLPAH